MARCLGVTLLTDCGRAISAIMIDLDQMDAQKKRIR